MCVVDEVFADGEGKGISRRLSQQGSGSHEDEQERKADHAANRANRTSACTIVV